MELKYKVIKTTLQHISTFLKKGLEGRFKLVAK